MGGTWTRRKMSGARWPAGARVDAMMRHERHFPALLYAAETSMAADAKGEAQCAEQRPRDRGRSVPTTPVKLFLVPFSSWISFFLE